MSDEQQTSSPRIIAITSGKGGVGKSTVCCQLGCALARLGKTAVIIELDFGLRGLDLMLGVKDNTVYDLGDVLAARCPIARAIVPTAFSENLFLMAAPTHFSKVKAEHIIKLGEILCENYDYVILDTPAGLSVSTAIIPKMADVALVVATLDPVSIRAGNRTSGLLRDSGFENNRLVINKVPRKPKKNQVDLDIVIDGVGEQLIGVLPYDDNVVTYALRGEALPKKDIAMRAFLNTASRLLGEDVPLLIK